MTMTDGLGGQANTMLCPHCGRKMRLNFLSWKEPRYVCESFYEGDDCGMMMILPSSST